MKNNHFRTFILFWVTQSVSQMGSAMSGYALTIWAYSKTRTAMSVSLLTFCYYISYVLVSLFCGSVIDRHGKKEIMLLSDSIAAICTLIAFFLWQSSELHLWHLYVINSVIGMMNALQAPAESVTIGLLVSADKQARASGMDSFTENLVTVVSPVFAAAVYGTVGLGAVFLVDFVSFLFASSVLLLYISIPVPESEQGQSAAVLPLSGIEDGFLFLRQHTILLYLITTMAVMNFFSRLTYENILSPMLLARSGDNAMVLSIVSAVLGLGGIVGGLAVSFDKKTRDPIRMVYWSAVISFLCGDLLMGIGRNVFVWCIAGMAASVPIPFIMAGQRLLLYRDVPTKVQGHIFSVRNAVQFSTIPIGILLGGFLADRVFEPLMQSNTPLVRILQFMVGAGDGSGMAVMFLCTGTLGSVFCIWSYERLKRFKYANL